ncbi:hypothetical protein [uncultured Mediterranea sp.]|uniref:hypothetical protein n=1 Tax=uncultured Mediterranea sp. TaxID=1926662 RepID=UPI0027D97538|nr:hypothetical protein [uncultured Mediterranea sp.]
MPSIPYKIQQIKTLQFAIFPEKFINGERVQTSASFNFSYNTSISSIRCTATIHFMQNEELLLTTEVQCFFNIAPEGITQLQKEQEIPVGFLQYMGTITTGTVRGIIHAKTEGTVLNSIVLPPLNLTEAITEGMRIESVK